MKFLPAYLHKRPWLFAFLLILTTCQEGSSLLFGLQDQVQLGQQTRDEILNNPGEYGTTLSRTEYPEAYAYLDEMFNEILASPELRYRDEFAWEIYLIDQEGTVNAFATPGGYIFVYTGLVQYLDNASQLAGVLGHEVAHSDREHSARNLERQYGVAFLLDLLLGGGEGGLAEIASQLALGSTSLSFSRDVEREADEFSVIYLNSTDYACNGAAGFFQKLRDQGQCNSFTWFSTHPDPCERVESINEEANQRSCTSSNLDEGAYDYNDFKADLP